MLMASWYTSANARLSSSIPTNMGAPLLPFLTWVLHFCRLYCHTVYLLLCNNYCVTILLIYIDVSIIHYFSEMCGHSATLATCRWSRRAKVPCSVGVARATCDRE